VSEGNYTDSEIIELLRTVRDDGEHSIPLRFQDAREEGLYRELASEGLIRWCPYPEECYVVTGEGLTRLNEESA
jgi:hypothetical protein